MASAVTGSDIRIRVKINDEWIKFPQLKTVPDVGGTPEKIDATHKESRTQEFIGGLQSLPDLAFVCVPAPRAVDGSDIISISNQMSEYEQYDFRIDYPRLGWRINGRGQFYFTMAGNTNADLQEYNFQIVPSYITAPIPLDELYTVTYDANGGTGEIEDSGSPYSPGDQVTVMADGELVPPVGQIFSHFAFTASGIGQIRYPGETFAIYDSVTLYAIWVDQ